jgi:hypothetical protein
MLLPPPRAKYIGWVFHETHKPPKLWLLLLARESPASCLYRESLPLDVFKEIYHWVRWVMVEEDLRRIKGLTKEEPLE